MSFRRRRRKGRSWSGRRSVTAGGRIAEGMEADQAPGAGRPEADRPHAALEPGDLHRAVRPRPQAVRRDRRRRAPAATTPDASRSTWPRGAARTCEGEGFVMVELLFLPSVYAPCPTCHGSRYNAKTLEIKYRGKIIADVLGMTVDAAVGVLRRRAPSCIARSTCCAGRARLPATRPAGDRALRRRGPAHQARDRAAAHVSGATRSTFSTSRRPACTRPTWNG